MESREDLLATRKRFHAHLAPEEADELIRLARSTETEDVDRLIKIAMTRGLRHPRFAVDAIEAELGQRFAKQSVDLAKQDVDLTKQNLDLAKQNVEMAKQNAWAAKLLLWVTALAALAAVGSAVAAIVGLFAHGTP